MAFFFLSIHGFICLNYTSVIIKYYFFNKLSHNHISMSYIHLMNISYNVSHVLREDEWYFKLNYLANFYNAHVICAQLQTELYNTHILLFSRLVMSYSFQPHGQQHTRLSVLHHFPEFTQTHSNELVMPFIYLILCCSLLLLSSIFPSIRVFSNESALHIRWYTRSRQTFLSNLISIAYILAQERNHPTYKRMPPGRVIFLFFFFPKDGKVLSSLQELTQIIVFQSSAPQSMEDKILATNVFITDVVSCLLRIFLSNAWFWIVMLLEWPYQSASAAKCINT